MKLYQIPIQFATEELCYPHYHNNIACNIAHEFINKIEEIVPPNDNIVLICRGLSGMYAASLLQMASIRKIAILPIRKKNDTHHAEPSFSIPENVYYIFVDDFIESGNTVFTCMTKFPIKGIVLYSNKCDMLCEEPNLYPEVSSNLEWVMTYSD